VFQKDPCSQTKYKTQEYIMPWKEKEIYPSNLPVTGLLDTK
jgi:hypothetical protein